MNSFLKNCKSLLPLKARSDVCLIFGNESCDLDSAVSAICLAFLYTHRPDSSPSNTKNIKKFLPVLNISKMYLPTKTEVTFSLQSHGIELENLITRQDIDDFSQSKVILVDHHVSDLWQQVIGIIDHRPFIEGAQIPSDCNKRIEEVGSCATLVADEVFKSMFSDNEELLKLLYEPIVLDTVNFSPEADKAREMDFKIVAQIEKHLNVKNVPKHREELFHRLVEARSDVSKLNSFEILWKDLKIISNKSAKNVVGIPGYPIAVQDYIKLPDAAENVQKFALANNCDVVILMGMKVSKESRVERDIGVINVKNSRLFDNILSELTKANLSLSEYQDVVFLSGKFFNQMNIKASRKQIVPIIQRLLDRE